MSRTTFQTTAEIFRNERGINVALLGQTFTPRPGSDSAKALSDEALRIQLAEATKTYLNYGRTLSTWSAHFDATTLGIRVEKAFSIAGSTDDLSVQMLIELDKDGTALVQAQFFRTALTEEGDHHEEVFLTGDSATLALRRTRNLLHLITVKVPELKVRAKKIVFIAERDAVTEPSITALARTLMDGDDIGWSFESEPQVACTLVEALPVLNAANIMSMRLAMSINGQDPANIYVRYVPMHEEITVLKRA